MANPKKALRTSLLLLAAAGCGSWPVPNSLPPPPSASVRAGVQHLTVVVTPPSAPDIGEPPSGPIEGMGAGALAGLGVGLAFMGASAGDMGHSEGPGGDDSFIVALWLVLTAVVVSVCVVGGTVYGTFAAMPADELEQRIAVVSAAWEASGPDLGIATELQRALCADRPDLVVDAGPAEDATLDVRILRYGLAARAGFDPDTMAVVVADVELNVPGTSPPYRARFAYQGPVRKFTEWTSDERVLGAELHLAASQLAQRVADEVLLVELEAPR
jgi:hypothetical protein